MITVRANQSRLLQQHYQWYNCHCVCSQRELLHLLNTPILSQVFFLILLHIDHPPLQKLLVYMQWSPLIWLLNIVNMILTIQVSSKSNLSAEHSCFLFIPRITTDSPPLSSAVTHLNASFKLTLSTHKSNTIQLTCYNLDEKCPGESLKIMS